MSPLSRAGVPGMTMITSVSLPKLVHAVTWPQATAGDGDGEDPNQNLGRPAPLAFGKVLNYSASEPSLATASTAGWSASNAGGRFKFDEKICFKRNPVPSQLYPEKTQVYLKSILPQKTAMSGAGLHTLPAMKGEFFRHSAHHFCRNEPREPVTVRPDVVQEAEELPLERETAVILNRILPTFDDRDDRPTRKIVSRRMAVAASKEASGNTRLTAKKNEKRGMTAQQNLLQFRQKLLDRFATMQGAFDMFSNEIHGGLERELPRKDFSRFLDKHFAGLTRDDHVRVFEFLDTDRSGGISISEFHAAIEAAVPVRSVEDLRRKFIALGYGSMRQALREMEYSTLGKKSLSFADLALALSRVGITEESEHAVIFQTILDPFPGNKTVSLEQLASSLAAVSPNLALEEVREKLLTKYQTVRNAYLNTDVDDSGYIDQAEFMRQATHCWGFTGRDAAKAFRMIDRDHSGIITRKEFASALNLAEPSLYHEDIRRKVRQRFRSIAEAVSKDEYGLDILVEKPCAPMCPYVEQEMPQTPPTGLPRPSSIGSDASGSTRNSPSKAMFNRMKARTAGSAVFGQYLPPALMAAWKKEGNDEEACRRLTPANFRDVLAKVQLTESETSCLFKLMDIDGDGKLSPVEFSRGVRLFAPGCVLEDLRLRCLASYARISDCFNCISNERRNAILNVDGLRDLLIEVGILGDTQVEAVMDLAEPHRAGGVSCCELISALQAAVPGSHVPLPPELRDARAKAQVKAQLSPFIGIARELRHDVRQKPHSKDKDDAITFNRAQHIKIEETVENDSEDEVDISGNKRKYPATTRVPMPWPIKQSYNRVTHQVGNLPFADRGPLQLRLKGYYTAAGDTVGGHKDLLSSPQSRFQSFKALEGHKKMIEKPANTK